MISTKNLTLESAWQKRFGFGLATVDVVAYSDGVFIIKDPIGVHFVKEDGNKVAVLGYNVTKKTLKRFLDRYGDWVIRRPQDLGLVDGARINGRVYKSRPTNLSTLYPGTLLPVEG